MRLVVPFPDEWARAIITQATERSQTDLSRIVLEIDAFKVVAGNVKDIWSEMQELREIKNKVFF